MPEHPMHNEYCQLSGLTDSKMMGLVNDMIDAPNFRPGYRNFRKKIGYPTLPGCGWKNHNRARRYPDDAELDLSYLKLQREDFRIAYFLHHFLDLYNLRKSRSTRPPSECRLWVVKEMQRLFGSGCIRGNLLYRYGLQSSYRRAGSFFMSSESLEWLSMLEAKRGLCRKSGERYMETLYEGDNSAELIR